MILWPSGSVRQAAAANKKEFGAGLVEVALILPLVLSLIFGTITLGILLYRSAAVQQSVNAAGTYLALHPEIVSSLFSADISARTASRQTLTNYALSNVTFAGMSGVSADRLTDGVVNPDAVGCKIAVLLPGEHVIFTTNEGEQSRVDHPLSAMPAAGIARPVVFVARLKILSFGSFSAYHNVTSVHLTAAP